MARFRFGMSLDVARCFARGTACLFVAPPLVWVGYEPGDTLVLEVWDDDGRSHRRGAVFRIVLAERRLLQNLEGMSLVRGEEKQGIEELLGRSFEAFRASWGNLYTDNPAYPDASWDDNPGVWVLIVERIEDEGPKFDYLCDPELEDEDLPEDPPKKRDSEEDASAD